MRFLDFFKEQWNLILGVVVSLLIVISGFVIPPEISTTYIESSIDLDMLCRFVVAGFTLLLLVPFSLYNGRQHLWIWWLSASVMFIFALWLFFSYNEFVNKNTTFKESSNERVIVGKNLIPSVKTVVDSLSKTGQNFSNQQLVEKFGQPQDIWPLKELETASIRVLKFYLLLVLLLSLSIMLGVQATYCVSKKIKR